MKKPKTPKLTMPALIAWLRKQSPRKRYVFVDNRNCLIARFVKSQGFKDVHVIPCALTADGRYYQYPYRLNQVASDDPATFGAALKRARAAA